MKKSIVILGVVILFIIQCESSQGGITDSPGIPSQGSVMYSIGEIYDYLINGTALAIRGSFQEPVAGPSSTMKTLREVGDNMRALLNQCDTFSQEVKTGRRFFCAEGSHWGVQTGTMAVGGGNLLATGQKIEYRSGDDGTYQKGINFSFIDNGDGTVTDNVTGLMWARDGGGPGCAGGLNMQWAQAVEWAENLVFAGYSDWRLPNIRELESIVDYSVYDPSIDQVYFPNTRLRWYWSSTTGKRDAHSAFIIIYDEGGEEDHLKHWYAYVRAVRGGR